MGVKDKVVRIGTVGISVSAALTWLAVEVYELKQESVGCSTKIEALKGTVEDHRESQQELIKLHLK